MNELEQIVQQMLGEGQPKENIDAVIAEYQKSNPDSNAGKTEAAAEETATVVAETPADTDLQSESGSLESQTPSTFAQSELEKKPIVFTSYEEQNNIKEDEVPREDIFDIVNEQIGDNLADAKKNMNMVLLGDEYFNDFPQKVLKLKESEIKEKEQELIGKYNVQNPEEFKKANDEFSVFQNNLIQEAVAGSNSYKNRLGTYHEAFVDKDRELRQKAQIKAEEDLKEANEEIIKLLADQTFGKIGGAILPDSFEKGLLKLSPMIGQAMDLGMPVFGALNQFDEGTTFAEKSKQLSDGKGYTTRKDGTVDVVNISGGINNYPTVKEAVDDYNNKANEKFAKGVEKFISSEKYQEQLKMFGKSPEILDGIQKGEFGEILGTQAGQMALAMVSFGTSTYAQEAGNILKEITEEKAREKFSDYDNKTSEEKREIILNIVKSGEIDFSQIEKTGTAIAALDLASNAFGLGKIAKAPIGSMFRNLAAKNYKGAVKAAKGELKEIAEASLFEMPTEAGQEAIGMVEVEQQLGKSKYLDGRKIFDLKQLGEAGAQALISTGPLVGGGRVGSKGIRQIARDAQGNISSDVKKQEDAIKILFENGSIDKKQRDDQLTALYEAENIANNTNYKNFEPEAREEMFDIQVEQQALANKNKEIDKEYVDLSSVYGKGQVERNNEKIQKLESEKAKVEAKQVRLFTGDKLRQYVNNNPDKFNGFQYLTFETTDQAKKYLENKGVDLTQENVAGLIDGKVYGIKIPQIKTIIDVKETAGKGVLGIGANVVHHEGLHALTASLDDASVIKIAKDLGLTLEKSNDPVLRAVGIKSQMRVDTDYSSAAAREQADEFISSVSDFMRFYQVAQRDIPTATALSNFGEKLAKALGTKELDLDLSGLENGAEVLTWLKKYNDFNGKPKLNFKLPTPKAATEIAEEDKKAKKIRIFDFDDTLAKSNSQVLYTLPDGTTGKLNATEYAKRDQELKNKGATFDFSEFSKVIDGKKGPLFEVAQKINAARGNEDLFVLTARPADVAGPIQEFLKLAGLDFKKENIIGLGDGTAQAKADWVQGKVDEGYNDFYFADDAIKNVNAVKDVLSDADVKSKVQQAKASKIVENVAFEEGSINNEFQNYTHDGKVNNAPESFQAEAAMAYEPLAQAVVDRISKIGLGISKEQDQFIIDYLSDNENKQDIVSDLTFGTERNKASSLLGLAKTYNPEVGSFGGYAKSQLANRAIRVLDERVGGQVTQGAQTLDAPESREIADSEQQVEITQPIIERLNLEGKISEDLNKLGEMATIKAEKAITSKDLSDLKKVNLRNKTFGDIFANRLFNDVKNALGKNTKTKSDFTNFLNNNYEALSDIALNYINFQKGSGPTAAWSLDNPPTKEEFVEYYEAKNEKASTRGDRKKSLNNAIARAISNDVRNKMVDDNPSINEGFKKVAGVPLASKVIPYDLFLDESLTTLKMLESQKVDLTGVKISSLASENDIIKYFDYQEKSVWPYLPKDFIIFTQENTSNQYTSNSGKGLLTEANNGKIRKELRPFFYTEAKKRINAFKNFGPDILIDGKPVENYKNKNYSTIQKPLERIANGNATLADNEKIAEFNKRNKAIGKEIYTRFNKAIQDDKQNAIGIAAFLNLATNNTEHFNRALAEVVGISINPKGQIKKDGSLGRKYEWEHAMQQSHVARILLEGMLDPNRDFNSEFEAVMNNFKLIGLDYSKNELLKQGGFQLSMTGNPEVKWDIIKGTWLSRYFNDIMAELGGIDPNGIMHISGVTLGQYYNIDTNGNSTRIMASKTLDEDFNKMLERVKGVKAEARYSEDRANKLARNKGRFKFFVPYSAEDFVGLIYPTLGKGREGDRNLQWYKENLLDPYAVAINQFEAAKVKTLQDWRNLKKKIKKSNVPLKKEAVRGFSNEEALRVYFWNQNNVVPETLSKKDTDALVKHVEDNPELVSFANSILDLLEGQNYPEPGSDWTAGSLTIDLIDNINKSKRADFLKDWQDNVDVVYSKDNMNKLKTLYGERYTEALENILYRMKTGRNRPIGKSRLENQWLNWVNDSVGTVMFFNTRSALLQTISSINFINFGDNNPLMAAKAFANQPQFWKDFSTLMNSDFLKSRRSGLKNDVNADEIANAAATSENKVKAALSSILKAGFLPTQIADSFAISIGGASFYRNRLNKYKKQGLSEKEATEKAMIDFREIAEESQQSSRPDRVSMQQASSLGRLVLAFANTPMQYTRLTKKAALDLINGRGDWKTNISKLLYYGAVQNIIFTAIQQALFAMMFDDDELDDEEKQESYYKIGNSIADTLMRGSGIYGAGAAAVKNIILEIIKQKQSKSPDFTKVGLKALTVSPPIDTKIRKLMQAGRAFTYRQSLRDIESKGISVDNPAALALGQVLSASVNVPADRFILKARNIKGSMDQELQTWQRIALALGYADWQIGADPRSIMQDLKNNNPKEYKRLKRLEKIEEVNKKREEANKKRKERKRKFLEDQNAPLKKLENGIAGRANNDGTIEIDPNLSPVERTKTIAHEKQHMKDMKAGKLNYDDNYVYWNGKKYERKNGKIKYKGKWYIEGHPSLPWEKKAYNAEPSTKEIKRKKLYA